MGNLDDLETRLIAIEDRRLKIEKEIKALTVESNGLYREQVILTNEKYRKHFHVKDHENNSDALAQLLYDAHISSAAADSLLEWIQSFGKNFLPSWGSLNGEGVMPSAELGFEEDEEIAAGIVRSISRFASLVHDGTGYAIFNIREHGYKTTGDWYLIVAGEKFDRAEVVDLQHATQINPDDISTSLKDALIYISQEHWMI